jgi:hypothetical protein
VDLRDGALYFVHAPHTGSKVSMASVDMKTRFFGFRPPDPNAAWLAAIGRPYEFSNRPSPNATRNYNTNSGGLCRLLENIFFNWSPPPPPPQEQVTSTIIPCGGPGYPPCDK